LAWLDVGPVEELPPGSVKIVVAGSISVGVYNLDGEFYAIEDRCSHDDGPLCEGISTPRRASRSARVTARTSTSAAGGP
jgi:3-phenylpropionate/trans-cinnamate dioxygenase ferredoxin subunit